MKRIGALARATPPSWACCTRSHPTLFKYRRVISAAQRRYQSRDSSKTSGSSQYYDRGSYPENFDRRAKKKRVSQIHNFGESSGGIEDPIVGLSAQEDDGNEHVIDEDGDGNEDEDLDGLEEYENGDEESMLHLDDMDRDLDQFAEYAEAEAEQVDAFDGPGGTNRYGLTREQMREFESEPDLLEPPYKEGLFAQSAERGEDAGPDPVFNQDDITSDAHGELEQHREMRELARAIVWDMPLLWNHRKEYEPPTAKTPLRFRYTTYLGETHPASRKVVVDFQPSMIADLTPVQLNKLVKLLGVRYNPSTETAKMSCEMFPTAPQNKRYLGDLIEKLLTAAKDDNDTFEDVPFDFRHHKVKKTIEFPEAWKMTKERRAELDRRRATQQLVNAPPPQSGESASTLEQLEPEHHRHSGEQPSSLDNLPMEETVLTPAEREWRER